MRIVSHAENVMRDWQEVMNIESNITKFIIFLFFSRS